MVVCSIFDTQTIIILRTPLAEEAPENDYDLLADDYFCAVAKFADAAFI